MKIRDKCLALAGLCLFIIMIIGTWFLRTVVTGGSFLTAVIMALIIATVLLLVWGVFIHRTVSVPLNKLREGAGEFSRGNLSHRLPVKGTDELALLAEQMNGMADSLQHSLRERETKLAECADALAAAGRAGIAVRHEINNPLTTVIGNVELLIERYEQKDKDLAAKLNVVLNSALRIADITRQLQEFKKEAIPSPGAGVKPAD